MASKNVKWYKCYGKQFGGCLNKLNIELINIWSSNSPPGHKCKRDENRYFYPNIHGSTSHNCQRWKQPKCLSTVYGLSMNKPDVVHIYNGISF